MPLGAWFDSFIKPEDRFSPQMAKEMADSIAKRMSPLQGQFPPNVGMVVDLTRSKGRYYDPEMWLNMGMTYCKVMERNFLLNLLKPVAVALSWLC